MNDDELEVGHHAVFMKRVIRAGKVDFSCVCHFMDDLREQQVDSVVSFESKFHADEEAFLWNNSINDVFAGEWVINRIDVNEPVYISTLGALLEDRIDDVRVDVPFAVGHRQVNKVSCFFRDRSVGLQILDHPNVVFKVDKFRVTFAKSS